ncbi:hypothetical protein ACFPN2_05200 [Steroidobacter flavus]|uniref:Uncharacterized protein n=1 Tax=Steroidobacter flavus TaxID=1842136 RepID=A0ABV8SNL9_9GAMM
MGNEIPPIDGFLDARQALVIRHQDMRCVVQEEGATQYKGFGGIQLVVWSGDFIGHPPQRIEMSDVVNGQLREERANLADELCGALSERQEGLSQNFAGLIETVASIGQGAFPQRISVHFRRQGALLIFVIAAPRDDYLYKTGCHKLFDRKCSLWRTYFCPAVAGYHGRRSKPTD